MKLSCLFQLLSLLLLFQSCAAKKGWSIKQFKFLCSDYNTTKVRLLRCDLVARRGFLGLVNIAVDYKGVTDLLMTLKLFHRNTKGRYLPYLIDVTLNPCNLAKYNTGNEIMVRAYKVFDRFDPNLPRGCPLTGPFNITDFDYDKEAEAFYPPIVAGLCG